MLRLLIITSFLAAGAATANAAPAKTPGGVMNRAFACVKNKPCAAADIFSGKALAEWNGISQMLGTQLIISRAELVPTVPAKGARRWQGKWGKAAAELGKAGFNHTALAKLGAGRAIVRIGPTTALALVVVEMSRGGRSREEYLVFSLTRKADGWRIAFIEDSVSKHVRFMKAHKP